MNQLLIRVEVPECHRGDLVAQRVKWYSWSPSAIELIKANLQLLLRLPTPRCILVRGCDPYPSTYNYQLSRLPEPLVRFALDGAEALLRVRFGPELKFLAGMLEPPLTSSILHKCFALIRAGIARLNNDPRTALHAPVKTKRVDEGFALHADLFLTERLLLVFDNVPEGKSGKSLFLSRDLFEDAVKANVLLPKATQHKLNRLMDGRGSADAFDECFSLIYSHENSWRRSLVQDMKRSSWAIKFSRGEGYMLHDRRWLHGRTRVTGGITETRFRRLVFGRRVNG